MQYKQGLSKEKHKWISSLKLKKIRQSTKLFVVEGVKMADEVLGNPDRYPIRGIYATAEWLEAPQRRDVLRPHQALITCLEQGELERISELQTPNQVLMVLQMDDDAMPALRSDQLYLALDSIQDPGNLGTIIRIADWFGISDVFCGKGCVDWSNHKTVQATMGSFLRVRVWDDLDLATFLTEQSAKMPIYGAILEGNNVLLHPPAERRGILLIGNESQGIQPAIRSAITAPIAIPRFGGAESLNAAVATGILCSHFFRK